MTHMNTHSKTAVHHFQTLFGIFGWPAHHSLSPVMHNAAFHALSLPYQYVAFEVAPEHLPDAVRAIRALGFGGVNVTIPHKQAVIPLLHAVDARAERIGAVNTIAVADGRFIGHNTDGEGFLRSLLEAGVDPVARPVVLLGAGGAALGVADALLDRGVSDLSIRARSLEKIAPVAARLTAAHPAARITTATLASPLPPSPILLINATPLGMNPEDALPCAIESVGPASVVADLVYGPNETPLLTEAKRRGATVVPGLGMLLHQGAMAFEIWTDRPAPLAVMRAALMQALRQT